MSSAAGRMLETVCPSSGNSGEEYLINNSFFLCPISSNSYSWVYACHSINRNLNTNHSIFVLTQNFNRCRISDVKLKRYEVCTDFGAATDFYVLWTVFLRLHHSLWNNKTKLVFRVQTKSCRHFQFWKFWDCQSDTDEDNGLLEYEGR